MILATLVVPLRAAVPADGDETEEERIARLENQVQELMAAYGELLSVAEGLQSELARMKGQATAEMGDDFFIPRTAVEFDESGQPDALGGLWTKPFLTRFGESTYVGGYIDLEYRDPSSGGGNREFDQHRLVPFIYADVTEQVKVSAEVEIEHGHELEVEFAQMDFLLHEMANLRAGIQLLPLGKFNEVHDSPIQDLTDRPLVNRYIIPSTLRDAGIGVWGDLGEQVGYNVVVSNGFKGLDADGNSAITSDSGLRNAAPQSDDLGDPFENTNDDLAYTGRVAWRPMLGVELGASAHADVYDENGDNDLWINALDATVDGKAFSFLPDNLELLYEGAWASIDRNSFAKDAGVAGNMRGYYVQGNLHFAPDFLERWSKAGGLADDGAHFTFVTRVGAVDLDDYVIRRTTLGLNYRPNESYSVIKLDYQFNDDHGVSAGKNNANAWLLSFASYF